MMIYKDIKEAFSKEIKDTTPSIFKNSNPRTKESFWDACTQAVFWDFSLITLPAKCSQPLRTHFPYYFDYLFCVRKGTLLRILIILYKRKSICLNIVIVNIFA